MDTEKFAITKVGDCTAREYAGTFEVKVKMSHRDYLTQDRIRRELIGPESAAPGIRAARIAEMLSQCAVRIVKAPSWWTDATEDGVAGLGLEDDNVLEAVYNETMMRDKRIAEALRKAEEQAKRDLKTEGAGSTE